MQLVINGINISVADQAVSQIVRERLLAAEFTISLQEMRPPRIGDYWEGQGGHYAGIARGRDGAPDYYLIVGPECDPRNWNNFVAYAPTVNIDGKTDFVPPSRKEQALMYANVPELFKEEAYWSGEQHAAISDYAYYQDFNNGHQASAARTMGSGLASSADYPFSYSVLSQHEPSHATTDLQVCL